MTLISIHGIKAIRADSLVTGGIKISFADNYHWNGDTEINAFTDDEILACRLVAAINRIVAERDAEIKAEICQPTSDEMETV